MEDTQKIAQEVINSLFKTLEVEGDTTITMHDDTAEVVLATSDSGIVIGHHGEILEALQLLLSLAITKKAGKFIRVSLEVGDYKKNRIAWLEQLATQTKEKALQQEREVELSNLKSWERRVIHLFLQNDDEVVCESFGEGKDRVLVIRPKQ